MSTSNESRQDLLNWMNGLLGLNITKIEELGKGYAICQIFDSIYLDVPLKKVKFNAKHEFEYIQNFKILQSVFDKHKIPNAIPVERLVKLKFQDNIEFCQFVKKFWDTYFPGHYYDAAGRRAGAPGATSSSAAAAPVSAASAAKPTPTARTAGGAHRTSSTTSLARGPGGVPSRTAAVGGGGSVAAALAQAQQQVADLSAQAEEAQTALEAMGKERDFFYGKLRQVEVMLQAMQEQGQDHVPIKDVLAVLYAADDGFENVEHADAAAAVETF
ncbi:hypothetical protein GGF31_007115 [Allomyces arbusculus]|nr:hypothetical protein GGF31_007115 [Allomyces arbusculus]